MTSCTLAVVPAKAGTQYTPAAEASLDPSVRCLLDPRSAHAFGVLGGDDRLSVVGRPLKDKIP